jgi:hypothetical protein
VRVRYDRGIKPEPLLNSGHLLGPSSLLAKLDDPERVYHCHASTTFAVDPQFIARASVIADRIQSLAAHVAIIANAPDSGKNKTRSKVVFLAVLVGQRISCCVKVRFKARDDAE